MANWSDYQSAIQFVAGLNIALYALPELRERGLASEHLRERALIERAYVVGLIEVGAKYDRRFQSERAVLDTWQDRLAHVCLFAAVISTVVLLLASGDMASCKANAWLAWGTVIGGLVPSVVATFLGRMVRASRKRSQCLQNQLARKITNRQTGGD